MVHSYKLHKLYRIAPGLIMPHSCMDLNWGYGVSTCKPMPSIFHFLSYRAQHAPLHCHPPSAARMKATIFIHSSVKHQRVCFGGDTSISLQTNVENHSVSNPTSRNYWLPCIPYQARCSIVVGGSPSHWQTELSDFIKSIRLRPTIPTTTSWRLRTLSTKRPLKSLRFWTSTGTIMTWLCKLSRSAPS